MAWADKGRQKRVMWATQTQQVLHSVLEARGLFFMSPVMGLSFYLVFGVWFGFFKLNLNSWNFSFLSPQHTFPPSLMPMLGLCRSIALACLLQRVATETREPCSSPWSCHPSIPQQLCIGMWHRMCPGSSGRLAKAGVSSSGLLNSPGVLDQQVSFYPLVFVFRVKQTG